MDFVQWQLADHCAEHSKILPKDTDTMADSWEDDTGEKIVLPPKASLNINAPSFSFNPGASSWTPPAAAQPAALTQQPAPPAQPEPSAAQPSHAEAPPAAAAPQQAADTAMAEPDHRQDGEEPAAGDVDMHQADNEASGEGWLRPA